MFKMIEQFVIPPSKLFFAMPGTRNLDYARIAELSDEDFAKLYLELMTEYKDKNGWWSPDKIPHCGVCHRVITGPAELRRYHGRTLDPTCFKEVYAEERKDFDGSPMQKYWDRVANLIIPPQVSR